MSQGPNIKKLIATKVSLEANRNGGGLVEALKYLKDSQSIANAIREATEWVRTTIQGLREAGEPNPWKAASDEAIAAEILHQINAKKSRMLDLAHAAEDAQYGFGGIPRGKP